VLGGSFLQLFEKSRQREFGIRFTCLLPQASKIYLGLCNPGDRSQSLIWDAVSAWRARRRSKSRVVLPTGCSSAACRNPTASAANRSSNVVTCLIRRRTLAMAISLYQKPHPVFVLSSKNCVCSPDDSEIAFLKLAIATAWKHSSKTMQKSTARVGYHTLWIWRTGYSRSLPTKTRGRWHESFCILHSRPSKECEHAVRVECDSCVPYRKGFEESRPSFEAGLYDAKNNTL
jgi:hypothetical protein